MPIIHLAIAIGLLALSIALVLAPRRPVERRVFSLFRVLFPAWRFFEAIAPSPRLHYRILGPDEAGDWRPLSDDVHQHRLLLNARDNLQLAYRSLLEQLLSDLESTPQDVTQLISYRLVQAMVMFRIAAADGGDRYQFMIASEEAPFISAVHDR
ncbi:MAG TPA: hypothetical protein VGI70_16580 [Polyangiales bacterium]|jgi:hypothetical protein